MTRRAGAVSVGELLLVFWLFGLVLLGIGTFLIRQRALAEAQRDLVRLRESVRVAAVVLGAELRYLTGLDLADASPASLRVRAIRGSGTVCGWNDAEVEVAYAGVRWPEPRKDSVLLVDARGEEVRAVRDAVWSNQCAVGGVRLILDRGLTAPPAVALVFEAGTYHAARGALRYEIGSGGRQPLTEEVFGDIRIAALPDPAGYGLTMTVHADSLPAAPRHARVAAPMLNPLR